MDTSKATQERRQGAFLQSARNLRLEALHFANTKRGEQFLREAIVRFDAALIVAAVNAYDAHRALVEAARSCEAILHNQHDPRSDDVVARLRAALAAVEQAQGKS